jgi:hypothetical protein
MCKASWLAGTPVNGNADIDNVSNVAEELVEISIGHLKGKIANEEGLGWWVLSSVLGFGLVHVVDNETAAFEDGLVLGFNGSGGFLNGVILEVSESA